MRCRSARAGTGGSALAQIDYELPELIDLLVVTIEAGLGFIASLRVAAERLQGPLGEELRLALQEQRMGLATDEALQEHARPLRHAGAALVRPVRRSRARRSASRSARSCGTWRRDAQAPARDRRGAAQKAPVKMLFPLIFLIFPAMFVVLLGPVFFKFGDSF